MPTKKKRFLAALVTLITLCILCSVVAVVFGPGLVVPGASKKTGTANILVYEDINGNGKQDSTERPLANAFIVVQSNLHGTFTRQTHLSNANGEAAVNLTYTHYFDVGVLPPCGYNPTTPTSLSAAGAWPFSTQSFGFKPKNPNPPMSSNSLYFQLWHDANGDGLNQAEDSPLKGVAFVLVPPLDQSYRYAGFDEDDLALTTDDLGRVSLDVGNFCGDLWLEQPEGWLTTMTNLESNQNDDMLRITTHEGRTDIDWGMHPEKSIITPIPPGHRFEFGFGGAYHPEGFGAWHVSLTSRGVFSVSHQVGDEIEYFDPVTLSRAENRPLWGAILAANIPNLPATFQRPGIPDETAYTFTLYDGRETHTVEMWVDEAKEYPGVPALVELLWEMVEVHTGRKMK